MKRILGLEVVADMPIGVAGLGAGRSGQAGTKTPSKAGAAQLGVNDDSDDDDFLDDSRYHSEDSEAFSGDDRDSRCDDGDDDDGFTVFSDGTNERFASPVSTGQGQGSPERGKGGKRAARGTGQGQGRDSKGEYITVEVSDLRVRGLVSASFYSRANPYVVVQSRFV